MKAVILAAGKGTRMEPLTEDTPKPLLPVAGKPIVEHNLELIEHEVEEVIIVAGYLKEQFEERYEDREDIRLIEQEEALGTADAALQAGEHVDGKALVLNGDDIYGKGVQRLMETESGVLAAEVDDPTKYGVFRTEDSKITEIVEKPDNPASSMANTGAYLVKENFFDLLENVQESKRGEYEITDALEDYIKEEEVELVEADRWIPCSYPWQLVEANEKLIKTEVGDGRIDGRVSPDAEIKGDVLIEEDAEVREFTTVEGPAIIKSESEVGPNAYIRPETVLEEAVKVGNSEVKNSVVREGSNVPHFNYVGDSYLGKDVNLGAGTKVANLRNDSSTIEMEVKGEFLDTGREKFGVIIGSEAKIGVNNSIKPGRKIGYGAVTDVNEKVDRNLPDRTVLKGGEIREDRD